MADYSRYAIYLVPDAGPFADYATAWLGWDIVTGSAVARPDVPDLPLSVQKITEMPSKYGFHGTIKPPMRLAEGRSLEDLIEATQTLLADQPAVSIDRLRLVSLGSFLALIPARDTRALRSLAEVVVSKLDPFRAPMTDAERARRNPGQLSSRQRELLDAWGYPYVFEEFQFHMTLTGPLSHHDTGEVEHHLSSALAPLLPTPFDVTSLSICGERPDGRFEVIERVPLGG